MSEGAFGYDSGYSYNIGSPCPPRALTPPHSRSPISGGEDQSSVEPGVDAGRKPRTYAPSGDAPSLTAQGWARYWYLRYGQLKHKARGLLTPNRVVAPDNASDGLIGYMRELRARLAEAEHRADVLEAELAAVTASARVPVVFQRTDDGGDDLSDEGEHLRACEGAAVGRWIAMRRNAQTGTVEGP
ncbi:hypothetical protein BV25DRAFT_1922887 [Artomyces pyxidatus]|uniref:Uncharacterized protein n=1 Tax=Artomyces pyxidatus TaxID=48021 RepID=A0ACB8SEP7_9AGAM|nr:hypothetical protein BV25DRAFT_1922887 [Artomyces pyxidatus]